eukprot:CAMPEP_0170590492 /NCGR_PEP_ID=MMETSP0224-20130122/11901_1 /TAXON_ID=285029 /ORGANISM="Togula jolla, Strain CCCM 725" /LENGTH=147 /DNA_ID=CAMNT_0010914297 /DNA_START=61 /DNA_END=501 /DNA_ORIENTATION=-
MARADMIQFSRGFGVGVAAFAMLVFCSYGPSAFLTPPATGGAGHLRASASIAEQNVVTDIPEASTASSMLGVGSMLTLAAVAAVGLRRREKTSSISLARGLPTIVSQGSTVTRQALDQSSRYADLSLTEEMLIQNGKHVLVAYIMKP